MKKEEEEILINGRFLTQKMTGTNRFAYEICLSFQQMGIPFKILTPSKIDNSYNVENFKIEKIGFFKSHFWEQITLPLYLWNKKNILLNFTGLGPIFRKNQISTIHDLSFLENPKWFSKSYFLFYKIMTPIMAKRARHILTVSNFSKQEIIKRLNIKSEKISVVYNAIPRCFHSKAICDSEKENGSKNPYILTVSSIDPRKNIKMLLNAYSIMNIEMPLYIIGGNNSVFNKLEIQQNLPNIHFLGRLSDSELSCYYRNASLFIYPSLYEGFGLPPLEAIACGCKNILLSDIPVFHEIYGNNVNYTPIDSPKSIASTMEKCLKEKNFHEWKDMEKKFNWIEIAKKILSIIKKEIL